MQPPELTADSFRSYPAEGRRLAGDHVVLLRQLPLAFLPLLLRELSVYDWKFPAERVELDGQLGYLRSLSKSQLEICMAPFAKLDLAGELGQFDWVNDPAGFSEHLTAHLWATHRIDTFRTAAVEYVHNLNRVLPAKPLVTPRLTIVVIGQGVQDNSYPLFRKLRPHGTLFTHVKATGGTTILFDTVKSRADKYPVPFGHWYIDGGSGGTMPYPAVTSISYRSLEPIRAKLLGTMEATMRAGDGSEALRSKLARIRPEELGLSSAGDTAVLDKFKISLLTEGSGTQIFSTTFVQWTAREALRRAQPLTLLARYAPRRHEELMSEILAAKQETISYDPAGSLVDADIGAYYTWINQQRLSGAESSAFLVWFEDHPQALTIAPSLGRGTEESNPITFAELLSRLH